MKLSYCFLGSVFTALSFTATAQDFKVPPDYSLKYTIDYGRYEKDVIKGLDWMENTPLDQDKQKHTETMSFLMKWINGAPNVHVQIESDFLNIKKNMPLLVIYMGEWSRYELKNGDKSNPKEACLSAIRAMIKVYQKGAGVAKDKNIEKLIALDKKGSLESYVETKLAQFKAAE